jgi:hypothetical protein
LDSSIVQGPFSVAPRQTLISRFATFSSPYAVASIAAVVPPPDGASASSRASIASRCSVHPCGTSRRMELSVRPTAGEKPPEWHLELGVSIPAQPRPRGGGRCVLVSPLYHITCSVYYLLPHMSASLPARHVGHPSGRLASPVPTPPAAPPLCHPSSHTCGPRLCVVMKACALRSMAPS